jgi:Tol biopolymer transport system component
MTALVLVTAVGVSAVWVSAVWVSAAGTMRDFVVLRQALTQPSSVDYLVALSADAPYVAFVSSAGLVPEDSNGIEDIYVFDRNHARLTLETPAWGGGAANDVSRHPDLSADGRYLVFHSEATNLTADVDTNGTSDVFLRDRTNGVTTRLSDAYTAAESNGPSRSPAISADGCIVAYVSHATNLVPSPDANGGGADVYLVRLDTRATFRASVTTTGHHASTGTSFSPRLNADGSVVVFTSTATLDSTPRPPGIAAVFVRELKTGVTRRISRANEIAFGPDVSADGRFVVFTSQADLRTWRRRTDVSLYDRISRTTTVLTGGGNAESAQPRISASGDIVAFQTQATNLACERRCMPDVRDENLLTDIYVFDRTNGAFTRVSGGPGSWWAPSMGPAIDAAGRVVAFLSRQPVARDDPTHDWDVFVWSSDQARIAPRERKQEHRTVDACEIQTAATGRDKG